VLLLLLVAGSGGGRLYEKDTSGAVSDPDIPTAPVSSTARCGQRAACRRCPRGARLIRDRIGAVATPQSPSTAGSSTAGILKILAGDRLIWGSRSRCDPEQVSRESSPVSRQRIQEAIAECAARSAAAPPCGCEHALAIPLAAGLRAVVWLWRRLDALTRRLRAHIRTVGIQSFEVMRADRIWSALRGGLQGCERSRLASAPVVGYVLALWPWTRGLSRDIVGFALAPLQLLGRGFVANIPSLIFLAVLFYVVRLMIRVFSLFFEAVGRGTVTLRGFDADWAGPHTRLSESRSSRSA
jgi:hypothetical protein